MRPTVHPQRVWLISWHTHIHTYIHAYTLSTMTTIIDRRARSNKVHKFSLTAYGNWHHVYLHVSVLYHSEEWRGGYHPPPNHTRVFSTPLFFLAEFSEKLFTSTFFSCKSLESVYSLMILYTKSKMPRRRWLSPPRSELIKIEMKFQRPPRFMFIGSSYPVRSMRLLHYQTQSAKSKMAAS